MENRKNIANALNLPNSKPLGDLTIRVAIVPGIVIYYRFIPAGAVTQTLQKLMIVVGPQKAKVQNTT